MRFNRPLVVDDRIGLEGDGGGVVTADDGHGSVGTKNSTEEGTLEVDCRR